MARAIRRSLAFGKVLPAVRKETALEYDSASGCFDRLMAFAEPFFHGDDGERNLDDDRSAVR